MNRMHLYKAIGEADSELLEKSEKAKEKKSSRTPFHIAAIAAVLAVTLAVGVFLKQSSNSPNLTAHAVAEAQYPKMSPYPDKSAFHLESTYEAWRNDKDAQRRPAGYADSANDFFINCIPQLLSGDDTQNKVCSPLNIYMALGMLAEVTDGNSHRQILDLLGAPDLKALRKQANDVWNAHYSNDGATTSILASSLWMDEAVNYQKATVEALAKNYYASAYRGKMGSDEFNQSLRKWLNEQTGGMLQEDIKNIELTPDVLIALATTIYFQAKWQSEFSKEDTGADVFYTADGEKTCDFMHRSSSNTYYWGEHFGAVSLPLGNNAGSMLFLLPDEGVSVQELANDRATADFILHFNDSAQQKRLIVNFAMPKFDIAAKRDLKKDLYALGITDVFDPNAADFSPLVENADGIYLAEARHNARVTTDEQGVTATAYTVMVNASGAEPPTEEIDFILNRPFLFAIVSDDGLPLFTGIVNQP